MAPTIAGSTATSAIVVIEPSAPLVIPSISMIIVSVCAVAGAASMTAPNKAIEKTILRTIPSPFGSGRAVAQVPDRPSIGPPSVAARPPPAVAFHYLVFAKRREREKSPSAYRATIRVCIGEDPLRSWMWPVAKSGKPKAKRMRRVVPVGEQENPLSRGPRGLPRSGKRGKTKAKRIRRGAAFGEEENPLSRGPSGLPRSGKSGNRRRSGSDAVRAPQRVKQPAGTPCTLDIRSPPPVRGSGRRPGSG